MQAKTLTKELVLAVVRGQLPLSALEDARIRLKIESQGVEGSERRISLNVKSLITVAPMPIDIANGLLVYKDSPEQLRQWAGFVLGASEIIDLEPLENWPEGDEILSALWDASFEGRLTEEAVRVAAALAES